MTYSKSDILTFKWQFSEALISKITKLAKKDPVLHDILRKKMAEIINQTPETIEHYKNLKYGLSDRMRVHIGKSHVLTFAYFRQENYIYFLDFAHHDEIYKK
ncbi:MAG TPA: addiction module toxin RelE [archaeon]|jgi:mRNA-degrading endonuclease RelE of RelBE toxin-antitoxin system|nr:addiction module toxin RelE [archaeon]